MLRGPEYRPEAEQSKVQLLYVLYWIAGAGSSLLFIHHLYCVGITGGVTKYIPISFILFTYLLQGTFLCVFSYFSSGGFTLPLQALK